MATISTKVDIDSCITIVLFKTIARLVDELKDKSVKCMNGKQHAVSVFVEQLNTTCQVLKTESLSTVMEPKLKKLDRHFVLQQETNFGITRNQQGLLTIINLL